MMRSLFLKIFLYFLLIIVLVSMTVMALTYFRDRQFPLLSHQNFARQAVTEYGRKAIQTYEERGIAGLDQLTLKLQQTVGIRLILFDAQGNPLTHRPTPRRFRHLAQKARHSGDVVFPMMGQHNSLAMTLTGPSGQIYVVAVNVPIRPSTQSALQNLVHGFLGWELLALLTITALVCYFLSRTLTAPITRLRRATRSFAAGDLSTRIGDQIKGTTELSELAHDFDDMAGKIENLVGSQQRLLRDISHELRSPLTRLGIALELARQNQPDGCENALNRIELEAERMNTMIGQLLGLTRLETDAEAPPFQEFDISQLLAQLVDDANFEAGRRQCRVVFSGATELNYVGAAELLAQAFENVIRNAVKYTAEKTAVSVTLAATTDTVTIEVADQGDGVPEEFLDKLFEPFYRVADARDRQSGGTGIGLAIAERAVKLHGGTISAHNQPGNGLMVRIELPLKNTPLT
jgi:two-component system sensor histidine kinase CpxA